MESSQLFGGDDQEECHSSESGWTMYIGSPVQGEDDDCSDPNRHVDHGEEFDDEENLETNHHDAINSDDSMASDASSGPSLREKTWEIKKGAGRHEAKVERNHHRSNYKDKKPVKKNRHDEERKEDEEDEAEVASKGAKFLFQGSSSKVRKNLARLGKTK